MTGESWLYSDESKWEGLFSDATPPAARARAQRLIVSVADAARIVAADDAVGRTLQGLLRSLAQDTGAAVTRATQEKIDRYLLPIVLHQNDPARSIAEYHAALERTPALFHLDTLPDIGQNVRRMLCDSPPNTLFSKLLQYSMPHVKHNRLAFPVLLPAEMYELPHAARCMFATCLGLYDDDDRRPIWPVRAHVFSVFYYLLSSASYSDMHRFCRDHVSLLRLSIAEYYIHFLLRNLPVEQQLQSMLFGKNTHPHDILRQTKYIINNFRTQTLQAADFEWAHLNARAQVAIEKCNRACKGKKKTFANENAIFGTLSADNIHEALELPPVPHAALLPQPSACANEITTVHAHVRIHTAALNIIQKQTAFLRRTMHDDTILSQLQTQFQLCLQCCVHEPAKRQTFKLGFHGRMMCSLCGSHRSVATVNMLGNILTAFSKTYYFCHFCGRVHRWHQLGVEFFTCAHAYAAAEARPREARPREPREPREAHHRPDTRDPDAREPRARAKPRCLLCAKSNGVSVWPVVDETLAAVHHVPLCFRHAPDEYARKYVRTVAQLKQFTLDKRTQAVLVSDRF